MKKAYLPGIIPLILAIVLVMASCKKNIAPGTGDTNDNNQYYISFKINNVQKKYTYTVANLNAGDGPPNTYTGYFGGGIKGDTLKNNFGFRIFDFNSISTDKTYNEGIFPPTSVPAAYCEYIDESGVIYVSFLSTYFPSLPFSVKITEITSSYVKGNFSGKVNAVNDFGTANSLVVSDGKFYLKRIN